MAMLYTINFEYRGGTYLAQVGSSSLAEVLGLWLKQISDEELARWAADREAIREAFVSKLLFLSKV